MADAVTKAEPEVVVHQLTAWSGPPGGTTSIAPLEAALDGALTALACYRLKAE
ncbi:hypothetical protein [Micromonospora sp. NPDC007230]|uniref:hypothetical protein n=1 Tax=Micromonospora sp. NPDC007230 TaxID=3364237 RepID=UPI0036B9CEE2